MIGLIPKRPNRQGIPSNIRRVPGRSRGPSGIHLTALILDAPVAFGGSAVSLLELPMSTGSMCDVLAPALIRSGAAQVLIVRTGNDCAPCSPQTRCRVVRQEQLAEMLVRSEASDYLLVIEPRYWPAYGYELPYLLEQSRNYRGATHALAVGADAEMVREKIDFDRNGVIKRVQRLYTRMSWPDTSRAKVFCSIVPASSAAEARWRCLSELRSELLKHACFSQDLPVTCDCYDLANQADVLSLSEQRTSQMARGPLPEGYARRGSNVIVGRECRIHPSVRLIPPVIMQDGVTVDEKATIIGPTLLGRHSHVGRSALVARCVVAGETAVAPGEYLWKQVVLPDRRPGRENYEPTAAESLSSFSADHESTPDSEERARAAPGHRWQLAIKRAIDMALAFVTLPLLAPIFLALAVLIKCTSRGPVFFAHPREGRNGREFPCLKFRSMVADADAQQRNLSASNEVDGPQFKLNDDPRRTSVGPWLRRTNFDELPQLINVLLGHMSLVGPRPSPFRENQICLSWRRARLTVRPGITGVWQLCRGDHPAGDFPQWIHYDLLYVKHFSIWLDLKILFYTLVTLGGRRRVPLSRLIREEH